MRVRLIESEFTRHRNKLLTANGFLPRPRPDGCWASAMALLMMVCEPKRGWREVLVMERRTRIEFAHCMRHIVEAYSEANVICVVLDNLNTHKPASLYETFPPEEARAIARKLEFHYTPKQGSWLNIAEIELAALSNRCLSQRIPDEESLRQQVAVNVRERNTKAAPVK